MTADDFEQDVNDNFRMAPDERFLFGMIVDAMRTYETAVERILTEGETVRDRFDQLKPSPWVAIRRDARTFIFDGLCRLRLGGINGPELIKPTPEPLGQGLDAPSAVPADVA